MKSRPKILVCGKHSCGKTSLIKAVCPEGTVPNEAIDDHQEGFDYVVYETEFVDFVDVARVDIECLVAAYKENSQNETKEHLLCDCVWYCIDGGETEISSGELEILKLFGDKALAVITKSELLEKEVQEKMIAELEKFVAEERIVTVSSEDKLGLSKLLDRSKYMIHGELGDDDDEEKSELFEEWDNYFSPQQKLWQTSIAEQADEYVYWGAGRAFAIAVVPIPLADVIPLVANEAYMIYKIGACYGYAVDQTILASFLGCLGASVAGKLAASFIPFLKAPIAAAVTYGVGSAAMAYFESDMKLGEEELKEIFTFAKQKGKEINWKTSA